MVGLSGINGAALRDLAEESPRNVVGFRVPGSDLEPNGSLREESVSRINESLHTHSTGNSEAGREPLSGVWVRPWLGGLLDPEVEGARRAGQDYLNPPSSSHTYGRRPILVVGDIVLVHDRPGRISDCQDRRSS